MRAWRIRTPLIGVAIVLVVSIASSLTHWTGRVPWGADPDALFYQAQSLEVRGVGHQAALDRVFTGPLSLPLRQQDVQDNPPSARRETDPHWVKYSSRFYRRRWVVPAFTAALDPVFGSRSLLIVSLAGYLAIGLLAYALLRRRFSVPISVLVASAIAWLPPVRWYSFQPMTDSWGLALLLASLGAGALVLDRRPRWLPLWIVLIAALSVTRDETVVLIVATAVVAIWTRTRESMTLAASALIASIPAPLLLGASLRENLAYVENGFHPPPDSSWGFVAHHYWPVLRQTLHDDVLLPHAFGWSTALTFVWYAGCLVVVLGVLELLLAQWSPDPFFRLAGATLLGGAAFILLTANFSGLRLEMVFVPSIAVGLALLVETGAAMAGFQQPRRMGAAGFEPATSRV